MPHLQKLNMNMIRIIKRRYTKYPAPKWVLFCEEMLKDGWRVSYYDSKTTVSKYIHIFKNNKRFKIRFSNHKPNRYKERENECDFYVGIGNYGMLKTDELITLLKEK